MAVNERRKGVCVCVCVRATKKLGFCQSIWIFKALKTNSDGKYGFFTILCVCILATMKEPEPW